MDLELWKTVKRQKKMTIEEIAKKANLPKGSVQNIFAGYVPNPRVDTVEAIERALGINEKSPINNGEAASALNIPEKYSDIRVALNEGDKNLTQDDIDDIVRFIEFTANKNKK
ncbi:MAG: helix-turn-helix transcriptional regulator [Clostridia bacterium]|nr:helix-turn-helix transcriptional regulator [Clostridia bacterium]